MHPQAGATPSRRRFLAVSATGAATGAAAPNGCALRVSTGADGAGGTVAMMVGADDLGPEPVKRAEKDTGLTGDCIAPRLPLPTDRSAVAGAVTNTCVPPAGTPLTNLRAAASVTYVVPILPTFPDARRGSAGTSTSGPK